MSDATQNDSLTRYLMYKVAIRADEGDLAAQCLERVYQSSSNDATLLYACVLDAQQAGDKLSGINALQLLLERHRHSPPGTTHLSALLRCTIRMIMSHLEANAHDPHSPIIKSMIDQLCKLFEYGSYAIFKPRCWC